MKPFTYAEYLIVQSIYEDYLHAQSVLRADSSDEEWERYDNLQALYRYELHILVN